jgi:hypothetical protein
MALNNVGEFISETRVLLQDTYAGNYRYSDADILQAINLAIAEVARLRPDLIFKVLRTGIPQYTGTGVEAVQIDHRYSASLLMFISAWVQLRDQEEAQDQRATALISQFRNQLVGA